MNNNSIAEINKDYNELQMVLRGIAHEMGNALTVMGYSLKSLGKNDLVRKNENWNYLNEDFDYICRLFRNLSAYNNGKELDLEEFCLNQVLESAVYKFRDEYKSNGVKISFLASKDYIINGDKTKLNQVFINIIKNAYEAIVYKQCDGKIEIQMYDDYEYVFVKICDNGCGMSKECIEKIFNPLYTSNKDGGTGLGLPVCKKIIESHGGNIQVYSKEDNGSQFIISIKK